MGYDYENAWNDLFALFKELPPNTESEIPLNNRTREWIRNKMLDIEKSITKSSLFS